MRFYEEDAKLLLEHLEAGDTRAFAFIYENYRKLLTVSAIMILKDEEAAKDLVQQFYIDFFEHQLYRKIKAPYSFKAYLVNCVRNRCLNLIRDTGRQKRRNDQMLAQFNANELTDSDQDDQDFTEPLNDALRAACQQMPLSVKAIELRYFQGMSREEIANQLGISTNTVKNNLIRGLKMLRQYLNIKISNDNSPLSHK
ncbi:RNA polymerase sigma factor [Chitinophaga sp. S165]|uniref:RNA polymerase sigma factor n=1 Tax=Chitinophaga sp. S165 TaxID=2135462 RepID=UPI000D70DA05|nr:sigma-70 family RNA polymerase sigma factor [Chitinophaga sp. S165]PWV55544.1 RNA polymerase sigma-70 factor (ECF subfamily) [Chitinophaga sp. S165]